jgi:hypothetical protein
VAAINGIELIDERAIEIEKGGAVAHGWPRIAGGHGLARIKILFPAKNRQREKNIW